MFIVLLYYFQGGATYGDEYFAELDYIEVVEKLKEGYEEDVINADGDDNDSVSTPENPVIFILFLYLVLIVIIVF